MSEKNYCTIYIVRHGQAQANVDKVVAGITDTPLTQEGAKQAQARAEDLTGVKFDAVFASDLARAKRTAEIIVMEKQLAVTTREILRERNFGEWEGRPEAEVHAESRHLLEELKQLSEMDKRAFKLSTGYESDVEISGRFITFLREIGVTFGGKTVLMVTHGSMMRALLIHLGFANYDELPPGAIANTGYFILESDGVDFKVIKTEGVSKIPA